jgi:16S rRNA (cytosine967-C5)-methyltransferase
MLARAANWLKPDGTMIYATCSLERAEGEAIASNADAVGLSILPITQDELPPQFKPDTQGTVRILPEPGIDGFYVARLARARDGS